MFIDAHCHLKFLDKSQTSLEHTLGRCKERNVGVLLAIGTNCEDSEENIKVSRETIAHDFFPRVFASVGIHPDNAQSSGSCDIERIRSFCSEKEVCCVGEIGLDFYRTREYAKIQQDIFIQQMEIAKSRNLPVQIHTRNAEEETMQILKSFNVSGVIHCFTGTEKFAFECLDLGYIISFSGIITFKKADALRDIVRKVPLDRMLIETDSPFLAPEPVRGTTNEPSNIPYIADVVARIKGISSDAVKEQIKENFFDLFTKAKVLSNNT